MTSFPVSVSTRDVSVHASPPSPRPLLLNATICTSDTPSSGIENMYERAQCVRKILLGVPRATLVVMRYLFAFLNQ